METLQFVLNTSLLRLPLNLLDLTNVQFALGYGHVKLLSLMFIAVVLVGGFCVIRSFMVREAGVSVAISATQVFLSLVQMAIACMVALIATEAVFRITETDLLKGSRFQRYDTKTCIITLSVSCIAGIIMASSQCKSNSLSATIAKTLAGLVIIPFVQAMLAFGTFCAVSLFWVVTVEFDLGSFLALLALSTLFGGGGTTVFIIFI